MIRFSTNYGDIDIELDFENAPISAENFQQYASDDFFTGTIFHRVIAGFVIQGGGMNSGLKEKANRRATISNEADNGLKNVRGALSMARTSDPHSATSQFFINLVDNDFLDHSSKSSQGWGYAVFGNVVAGMDVVDKIAQVKTGSLRGHRDVPTEEIIIEKTTIL